MDEDLKKAYKIVERSTNDIYLADLKLKTLPSNIPEIVNGNFYCYNNDLTSLKGAPKIVNGHFSCSGNQLTSLKHCPKIVNGNFYCSANRLSSLRNSPKIVNGSFFYYRDKRKMTDFSGLSPFIKGGFNLLSDVTKTHHRNSLQKEKILWKKI